MNFPTKLLSVINTARALPHTDFMKKGYNKATAWAVSKISNQPKQVTTSLFSQSSQHTTQSTGRSATVPMAQAQHSKFTRSLTSTPIKLPTEYTSELREADKETLLLELASIPSDPNDSEKMKSAKQKFITFILNTKFKHDVTEPEASSTTWQNIGRNGNILKTHIPEDEIINVDSSTSAIF